MTVILIRAGLDVAVVNAVNEVLDELAKLQDPKWHPDWDPDALSWRAVRSQNEDALRAALYTCCSHHPAQPVIARQMLTRIAALALEQRLLIKLGDTAA